jgi:hypothetical protein
LLPVAYFFTASQGVGAFADFLTASDLSRAATFRTVCPTLSFTGQSSRPAQAPALKLFKAGQFTDTVRTAAFILLL